MKQQIANAKFVSLGLKKNFDYSRNHYNYRVQINYKGGKQWRDLIRTTPKSVFIWESDFHKDIGKQRRIDVRHIIAVNGDGMYNGRT